MTDRAPLETEPYKGVRDFYPVDWAKLSVLFEKEREVLRSFGYEEYQASPLERSELYESKGNEEIIREQTYTFEDRGGRSVTLRPEMTPTLARMVAAKRRELAFPLRWFSIGNRFRYERPQRGRLREFFQTDVDLVGLPEGEADLEIITLAYEFLTSLGAREADFSIRVNSRKLIRLASEAVGLLEGETSRAYWQLIDRKAKMPAEAFTQARKEFSADPLAAIESGKYPAVVAEKTRIEGMLATLRERGIKNATFDTDIVRGFDYYTGMVFEVFDTDPANPRSLFGGGRYDDLTSLFGGESIPAVGFAVGDVVLMDFLETHDIALPMKETADLYLATPDSESIPAAQTFAATLRKEGLRVFVNLTEKALGDQIRDALKRSIPYFVAYGSTEATGKKVKVKHLASGKEKVVEKKKLARFIHHA